MRLVAIMLTSLAALVGACGTNLAREEFVERAEGLCAQAVLLDKHVLESLREIVPPRELASSYGKFLDEAEKGDRAAAAEAARASGLARCARLAGGGAAA